MKLHDLKSPKLLAPQEDCWPRYWWQGRQDSRTRHQGRRLADRFLTVRRRQLPLLQRIPKLKGSPTPSAWSTRPSIWTPSWRLTSPTSPLTCSLIADSCVRRTSSRFLDAALSTRRSTCRPTASRLAKTAIEAAGGTTTELAKPFAVRPLRRATSTRTAKTELCLSASPTSFVSRTFAQGPVHHCIICLYQLGANLPIPGVSWSQVRLLQSKAGASGALGFLNLSPAVR